MPVPSSTANEDLFFSQHLTSWSWANIQRSFLCGPIVQGHVAYRPTYFSVDVSR